MKTNFKNITIIIINIIFYSLFLSLSAQQWTDPINISPNMPGLDNQPDLCIDKNGTLHCVFTHKLEQNWRKIYYSKSTDDGLSWTTPEDISLNPNTSLMNPHIVADTNNKLYVTYDYNTGNPAAIQIKLKTFDGNQWSDPFIVSNGMYSCHQNKLFIDNNNRLYIFWIHQTSLTYYRYFENGQWSDTICPYYGNFSWILSSAVIDTTNNLLCVGSYSQPGPPIIPQSTIFFKYDYINGEWTEKAFISPPTDYGSVGGLDIDKFSTDFPAVTYHQRTYGTGPYNDSTMYTYFNGTNWTEPELIVNDPYEQKIAVDPYNRVHIIDREKLETGTKLVHYRKINNLWQGYIIDEAEIVVANPSIIEIDNILYLVYYKCFSDNDCKIRFTKNYLLTGFQTYKYFLKEYNIYPNPFKTQTTIEFTISKKQQIYISIYDLNGKHIKTLKKKYFDAGTYRTIWNGKAENGKEVNKGLYLVRLQSGRNIITKPVEYIK